MSIDGPSIRSPIFWGLGWFKGVEVVLIDIPIRLLYKLWADFAPFGHNAQRGRQTDYKAIGTGRLCYSIGGLLLVCLYIT